MEVIKNLSVICRLECSRLRVSCLESHRGLRVCDNFVMIKASIRLDRFVIVLHILILLMLIVYLILLFTPL